MFEIIFTSEYLSGAASALTIVTLAFSVVGFLKKRRKRLFIASRSREFLKHELPQGIKITYSDGKTSSSHLRVDRHLLVNKSDVNLTDSAFAHPIRWKKEAGTKIFYAKLLDVTGSGKVNFEILEDCLELRDVHLPRGGGLAIEVAHEGGLELQIDITPVHLADPVKYTVTHALDSMYALIVLTPIAVAVMYLGVTLDVNYFDIKILNTAVKFVSMFFGVGIMYVVATAPEKNWLISRLADKLAGLLPVELEYLQKIKMQ